MIRSAEKGIEQWPVEIAWVSYQMKQEPHSERVRYNVCCGYTFGTVSFPIFSLCRMFFFSLFHNSKKTFLSCLWAVWTILNRDRNSRVMEIIDTLTVHCVPTVCVYGKTSEVMETLGAESLCPFCREVLFSFFVHFHTGQVDDWDRALLHEHQPSRLHRFWQVQ